MKLVLIPRSTLKFKSVPQLPGAVLGTSPIVVTAAGLAYTVSFNLPALITSLNTVFAPISAIGPDNAAIEALTGTGIATRTGIETWALRSLVAPAAGITVTNADGAAGNPTLVLANDLAAVEGLAANGMAARTATSTWAVRTITAPAAGITMSNGDGVAGNPTLALANDLAALEAIAGTNSIPYRSGVDTWGTVTISTGLAFSGGNLTADGTVAVATAGQVKSSSPSAGIGYATGAGGTVTQATSKSTAVTLNNACGQITMNGAALASGTVASFVFNNSMIVATDLMVLNHVAIGSFGSYLLNARSGAGFASIDVRNISAGSLSEAIVIGFAVIKGVNA